MLNFIIYVFRIIKREIKIARDYKKIFKQNIYNQKYKEFYSQTYANGGTLCYYEDKYTLIVYNTGDQVWLSYKDNKYIVDKVIDQDGHLI